MRAAVDPAVGCRFENIRNTVDSDMTFPSRVRTNPTRSLSPPPSVMLCMQPRPHRPSLLPATSHRLTNRASYRQTAGLHPQNRPHTLAPLLRPRRAVREPACAVGVIHGKQRSVLPCRSRRMPNAASGSVRQASSKPPCTLGEVILAAPRIVGGREEIRCRPTLSRP